MERERSNLQFSLVFPTRLRSSYDTSLTIIGRHLFSPVVLQVLNLWRLSICSMPIPCTSKFYTKSPCLVSVFHNSMLKNIVSTRIGLKRIQGIVSINHQVLTSSRQPKLFVLNTRYSTARASIEYTLCLVSLTERSMANLFSKLRTAEINKSNLCSLSSRKDKKKAKM